MEIIGNASLLGQVLLNLVINASHAMADQPIRTLLVRVLADDANNGVIMTVTDSGGRIPPGNLEHIFLPFFTTKPASGTDQAIVDTGLGLAVCRTFVQQHGGTITVDSHLGRGSMFQVWLPRTTTPTRGRRECTMPFLSTVARRRVLSVDDEPAVCEIFSLALAELGLVIGQAASVRDAIEQLDLAMPELVLTDWQMPGNTGRTMIEHLLKIPVDCRLAVIVSSGNLSTNRSGLVARPSASDHFGQAHPAA